MTNQKAAPQLTVKIVTEVLHDVSVMAHDDEVWSPTDSGHKERLQMTLSSLSSPGAQSVSHENTKSENPSSEGGGDMRLVTC